MKPEVEVSIIPAADAGELRLIALNELHESPLNSRKYFAETAMAELAESIRHDGIRVPLIVRPRLDGSGYEIAAGHRRRRAALIAGVAYAPCVVREMTDTEFLKLITFDNLQREDIHPMEEAEAFELYMREALADVADVAGKAGKSASYVYQRLKLLELTDEAKRAFQDGKITAGHAILIARLAPLGQAKALRACEPPQFDPNRPPMSVRALADWIQRNLQLDLKEAVFPIASAELLPEAGSCEECPHRIGNHPDFDPLNDLPYGCMRPECYDQKVAAFVKAEAVRLKEVHGDKFVLISTANAEGAIPRGKWWYRHEQHPGALVGLLVDGDGIGTILKVLLEDPNKPKPAPTPQTEAPQPAKPKATKEEKEREAKRREEEKKRQAEEESRLKREREEREAKLEKEKTVRKAILGAILEKVSWPPKREEFIPLLSDLDLPELMDDFITAQGIAVTGNYIHTADLAKCSDNQLARMALLVAVSNDFDDYAFGHGCDKLYDAAKRYGVDHRKIRAEAEGGTRKEVVAKLPALTGPAAKKTAPAKKAAAKKKPARLDPSTRKRIAEAQKKRWQQHKDQQAKKGGKK